MKRLFENYDLDKLFKYCQEILEQCEKECDFLRGLYNKNKDENHDLNEKIKTEILYARTTIDAYIAYEVDGKSDLLFEILSAEYENILSDIEAKHKI